MEPGEEAPSSELKSKESCRQTAPTGATNGGVPCCKDRADFEMTCRPWLVRAMRCMMHDESAREMARVSNALDRIDRIVGVPSCCSWMMIRE